MLEMSNERVYPLADNLGVIQGVMKVRDEQSYNEDTHCFDIDTPRVEIRIVGRICSSDEKTMAEEIEKFVKAFYL